MYANETFSVLQLKTHVSGPFMRKWSHIMLIISIMIPDWQMSMNVYLEQVAVHSYAITPLEATYVVATLAMH